MAAGSVKKFVFASDFADYKFYVRRMQPRSVAPVCDRPLLREPLDDDRTNPPPGKDGVQVKINPLA